MKKVIEKCKKAEVYMYLIPSMVIFSIFLFYLQIPAHLTTHSAKS